MEPTPRPSPHHPPEAPAPLGRVVRVASGAMVALTFVACAFVTVGTLTGRWTLLSVPTGSMEPAIPTGAGVVVVPTEVDEVAVGDIIVFRAPETQALTVHRVAGIETLDDSPVFRTKGDANPVQDPWELKVDEAHVGRVISVSPSLGAFTEVAGDRVVRLGAAGLGAVMVLFAGLRAIWSKEHPTDGGPDRTSAGGDGVLAAGRDPG